MPLSDRWQPGSRVARLRSSHSYGLVFLLIAAVFVFTSVASNSDWADSTLLLLQTATLVAALYTSGVARADSTISVGLIVISASCALLLLVFGGTAFEALVGILSGVLTVATIYAVALGVIDQGEANVQAVTGAICVYVLIGILFVFLYGVLATSGPATSSPREPTGRAPCGSTSASSRWPRSGTATTPRPESLAARSPSWRRSSASSTW